MTVALVGLLAFVVVGFLVVLDRRDKRAHEERQAHRLEVVGLVRRVQAPEVAVAQDAAQMMPDFDEEPERELEYPGSS